MSGDLHDAVHELAASEIPRAYLFRGTREITTQEVAKLLGLGLVQYKRQAGMPGPSGTPGIGRFLLPYSECEYTLESIIDDLQVRLVKCNCLPPALWHMLDDRIPCVHEQSEAGNCTQQDPYQEQSHGSLATALREHVGRSVDHINKQQESGAILTCVCMSVCDCTCWCVARPPAQ